MSLTLRPMKREERDLFYTATADEDVALGTVGHLRAYFDKGGTHFWSDWLPHNEDTLSTPEFKAELQQLVDSWRESGPLKDLASMQAFCHQNDPGHGRTSGFVAESEHYRYCLRCTPVSGEYNAYLYIYDKRQQELHQASQLTPMKLYMPLHCDLFERDEYGDLDEHPYEMDGRGALPYMGKITAAIEAHKLPEESERGLLHWYGESDSVNDKVHSAVFSVEQRADTLWGVVECALKEPLSDPELVTLKDYLIGQASDGWGEGFEQQDIPVEDDAVLNVHLWSSGKTWQMMTEAEFAQKYEQTQAAEPQLDTMSY